MLTGLWLVLAAMALIALAWAWARDIRGLTSVFYARVIRSWGRVGLGEIYGRAVPPRLFRYGASIAIGVMGLALAALGLGRWTR